MKMTKVRKSRIVAIILAVLMVVSVVPLAALSVNAAGVTTLSKPEILSGETITVNNFERTYNGFDPISGVPDFDATGASLDPSKNARHYATVTMRNIDSIHAMDLNFGQAVPSLVGQSEKVSVSCQTDSSYNAADMLRELNSKLDAASSNHYPISMALPFTQNRLKNVRVNYWGNEQKTLHLYAKITAYTYRYDNMEGYPKLVKTNAPIYEYVGTVTVVPSSLNLQVNCDTMQIAAGRDAIVNLSTGSAMVEYTADYSGAPGIASVLQLGGPTSGMFRVTANYVDTVTNRVVFTAYLKKNGQYAYRDRSGCLQYVDSLDAAKAFGTPISDTKMLYFSTVPPISFIRFQQSSYAIEVGERMTTGVSVVPSSAMKNVAYSSSNPQVVTIDEKGNITGVNEGTAVITASAVDGSGVAATAKVTVTKQTVKLTLDKESATVYAKDQITLKAQLQAEGLKDMTIDWKSSDTSVATVRDGVVTGIKEGRAVITAICRAKPSKTASCVVTVKPAQYRITMPDRMTLTKGDVKKIPVTVENTSQKGLMYSSDDFSVVRIDEYGNMIAVDEGVATITVILQADPTIRGKCIVNVLPNEEAANAIELTAKYVKGSKFYWTEGVGSADIQEALWLNKDVFIQVNSKKISNKVIFSRYAIARLAKYADSLTVEVGGHTYKFDADDLNKMSIGRPVYLYNNSTKMIVKYKNSAGKYVTMKVTPKRVK